MRRTVAVLLIAVAGCSAARKPAPPSSPSAARLALATDKSAAFAQAYHDIRLGEFAQAQPLLGPLIGNYPELQDYCLYYLGVSLARTGAPDRALPLWAELMQSYPQSLYYARAALESGRILRQRGDVTRARAMLTTAQSAGDTAVSTDATFELAEIDFAAGDYSSAYVAYQRVRRASPGAGAGKDAKARVVELRRLNPSLMPVGAEQRAELDLLVREGDHAAAIATANALLATAADSERPELLRIRATAEIANGQRDEGIATLDEIVARYPQSAAAPEALFRSGSLLWNRDQNAAAEERFVRLRRSYPGDAHGVDALYAIARIDLDGGDAEGAIRDFDRLAQDYPGTPLAHEASWRIGWIRYGQGRWQDAAQAFATLAHAEGTENGADAVYWEARSLEHAGQTGTARELYGEILERAPGTYYAYWAEQRLGRPTRVGVAAGSETASTRIAVPANLDGNFHLIRARALQAAGVRSLALRELRAFEHEGAGDSERIVFLVTAYPAADGYRDAIRAQKLIGTPTPEQLFPLAYWPQITAATSANDTDPLLVLALMRQESLFDPEARSPAGARGLMQLLPRTAAATGAEIGRPVRTEELEDPDVNITIGVAHFSGLLQRYQGDRLKALAAYNGGPDAVAKWERRFGSLEADEFIESITYRETRDYVKRVVANYRRYQQLYGAAS